MDAGVGVYECVSAFVTQSLRLSFSLSVCLSISFSVSPPIFLCACVYKCTYVVCVFAWCNKKMNNEHCSPPYVGRYIVRYKLLRKIIDAYTNPTKKI